MGARRQVNNFASLSLMTRKALFGLALLHDLSSDKTVETVHAGPHLPV